jgi:hypothetical protein
MTNNEELQGCEQNIQIFHAKINFLFKLFAADICRSRLSRTVADLARLLVDSARAVSLAIADQVLADELVVVAVEVDLHRWKFDLKRQKDWLE